jgi:hypothetical protein
MKTEFEYFIFFFRLLSLFLSLIYFILLLFFKKLDIINEITLIKNNFQASPIYSISQSLTGKCNENESIYKLGYFPGILKGRFYKKRVYVGKCNKFHSSKCKTINKIDGFDLNKWDGNTFCVNTNSELNYETFIRNSVENNNECDIGFKKCGFLDSNNRIMCIEENNNCPINKIIINNNEKSPTDFNYVTLSLNNNKFLHYTNESINSNIIVNFSISSGIPCLNPNEINTKYPQYILDKNFRRYICTDKILNEFNDNSFIKLDTIKKSLLYQQNNVNDIIDKLYNYPYFSLEEDINLYVRNYFGIDKLCIENEKKFYSNKLLEIDNFIHKKKFIYVHFRLSYAIFCSFIIINFIMYFIPNKEDNIYTFFLIVNFCLYLLNTISFLYNFLVFLYFKEIDFKSLCYNNKIEFEINNNRKRINRTKNFELINLIYTFFIILVILFLFINFYLKSPNYYINNQREQRFIEFDRTLNLNRNNNEQKNKNIEIICDLNEYFCNLQI